MTCSIPPSFPSSTSSWSARDDEDSNRNNNSNSNEEVEESSNNNRNRNGRLSSDEAIRQALAIINGTYDVQEHIAGSHQILRIGHYHRPPSSDLATMTAFIERAIAIAVDGESSGSSSAPEPVVQTYNNNINGEEHQVISRISNNDNGTDNDDNENHSPSSDELEIDDGGHQ